MPRKKSSNSWLTRQKKDRFVAKAQQCGYRSRASFKLLELHRSDKLFKAGMQVVELGAAPGGWSQVLGQLIGKKGRIIAVDLLDMPPIAGVEFIQGDFNTQLVQQRILSLIEPTGVDWVISDMAPNLSGMSSIDQPKIMRLAYEAYEFSCQILSEGGGLLIKVFHGDEIKAFTNHLKQNFQSVLIRKPSASRQQSSEIYILAKQYKPVAV